MNRSRTRAALAVGASAALVGAGVALSNMTAHAAGAGCSVAYSITSQWGGGFGANVTLTNLGDPVSAWTVGWSFGAGQQVSQAWNATVTQSGAQVSAASMSYNGALASGGSTSFGFNGTWNNSSNPIPTAFTMNGVACTGGVSSSSSSPSTSPSSSSSSSVPPPSQEPCDIYAAAGTPCVAAHSTTRALYGAYNGSLYQVRRSSDNATANIGVLSAGGPANAAAQDSFCANTSCVITVIYDQSGRGNNLTQAPAGGAAGGPDNLANATSAPTTLNGHKAYGVYVAVGTGYRNNSTHGIATGDASEGEYAIFDGTHYNGGCCFDYGNAETNSNDDGNGTMEAIYFGNIRVWGYGSGNGPWIMADLENGLFSGVNQHYNANDPTINYRYTTAMIEGGQNQWAILGGNAQSGNLSTFYSGPRPNVSGYNPMRKQGAIILGTGGDNSKGSDGTFYEGVMTTGYPSAATENAVQANITAAGYGR